jgi:chromosome segregation ATPase
MSENVLETVRATVQDFLAPELKTHGVRLEGLERRLDDTRHSLEQKIDDTKDVLRAEIKTLEAKMDGRFNAIDGRFNALDGRFAAIDARFATLEGLIRNLTQQVTFESGLRERMASLEARLPKQ